MSKTFPPYDPEQQLLLAAALQDWLPEGHLAYLVSDVVDQLNLSAITDCYAEERGGPPYHPRMMVKVLLNSYCIGVASSRRMAQRLHEDIAFRVLAANNTPGFRKDHLAALAELFHRVLELWREAGLVKLGHVRPEQNQGPRQRVDARGNELREVSPPMRKCAKSSGWS